MKKCIIILLILMCISNVSLADTKYVIVQTELNVRSSPSLGSHIYGRLFTGDTVQVTKTYYGWSYLEGLNSEEGCGWISSKYIVDDPVIHMDNVPAVVHANGRVAIRDSVDGKRISWVHSGDVLYVCGTSDSWTVTNRGYIKTQYLKFK